MNIDLAIIIGTRPQYIKLKPIFDYLKKLEYNFVVIDTNQHYDSKLSSSMVHQLGLTIDYDLSADTSSSCTFMADVLGKLSALLGSLRPRAVMVLGDTNSTLVASLVANKLGICLLHIEAGVRCGNRSRPEEMNRILVDELSNVHLISREADSSNVSNPVLIGDLEYQLINQLEDDGKIPYVDMSMKILMTIHRAENTSPDALACIMLEVGRCPSEVVFPIHHRTRACIQETGLRIPDNVEVVEPYPYLEMLATLSSCRAIISDSGGVTKVAPYFGKRCCIPPGPVEWVEIVDSGYGKTEWDFDWLLSGDLPRIRDFYLAENGLAKMCENLP